jgi:hypothetical protein
MKNPPGTLLYIFLVVLLLQPLLSEADDVGLITAKLTEQEGYHYVLEADVTPQLLDTLFRPLLPAGFKNGETEYSRQGALINVRYPFTGSRALTAADTLSLPWNRSGVLLHSRWADGTKGSDLFLRTTQGIAVDIGRIKPVEISRAEQIRIGFREGFSRVSRDWKLWLPVLAIGLLFPGRRAGHYLFMLVAGLAASLIILDFYPVEIPPAMAALLVLVSVLLAARLPGENLTPVFIAAAAVLGLSGMSGLSPEPRTAFVLGMLLFYTGAGIPLIFVRSLHRKESPPRWIPVVLGGLAVAGLIQTITAPKPNETDRRPDPVLNQLKQAVSAKPSVKSAPRRLTDPVVVFLTIEPCEVRFEIMTAGRTIIELLDFPHAAPDSIAVAEQPALKQQALEKLENLFTVAFDEAPAEPSLRRGDFLTLGTAGAFTRTEDVPEPLDDAILGLTFAYIRSGPPQQIEINWKNLPVTGIPVPATVIEPGGNRGYTFTDGQLSLLWKNESDELDPAEIIAVDVRRPGWAPVALLLLIGALSVLKKPAAGYACIAFSLIAFPLVRVPLPHGSPLPAEQAKGITEALLTNVYRSFDFRQESAIYDQLAISVTGDQLAEIYLDQRRAHELENRGGARARVETVEVLEIESVRAAGPGADVTARWKVSGSVNHFGHTHYRQNAYHAVLKLIPVDGVWKITGIDVYEENRIY